VDQASSSPTVLPDGSVLFGVLDRYNFARGHLLHFDAQGSFLNAFGFGWDSTPGIYAHGGTFSVVVKDNHYQASAYCGFNHPVCSVSPDGPYYITQLAADLTTVEWQFQDTTLDASHANGFEWCINMPAIDADGNVYVNSEDGNIYRLPQGHSGVFTAPAGRLFLNQALGAAYTPLSIGPDGKLYTQNNGHLFAVGN
jgi:outer membrane protein assembly factor BamB